jgi:hypothetical protein
MQRKPPQDAGRFDDTRVAEELSQEAPHGRRVRRIRSAKVDDQNAEAIRSIVTEAGRADEGRHAANLERWEPKDTGSLQYCRKRRKSKDY